MSTLKVNNITDLGNDAVVTSGVLDTLAVPAGGILQVVQTVKSDSVSYATQTFTDLTGMSATITPSSTDSKILVQVQIQSGGALWQTLGSLFRLTRGGTAIGESSGMTNDATLAIRWVGITEGNSQALTMPGFISYLDSPATTSATTYQLQARCGNATNTNYLNRSYDNSWGGISTITVMEVAG